MTAEEFLRRRSDPVRLVIFDCDGVLVDSEPVSNRVLAEDLARRGWVMTPAEAEQRFLGTSIEAIEQDAQARLGGTLPTDWRSQIKRAIVSAMSFEAVAVPGALDALRALTEVGMPWRVASNSSHQEMAVKFERIGIGHGVAGRLHSYEDVARGKPAPDVYLAAAAAEGVAPRDCLVVEDSVPGVTAAVAAGMDCLGYDRSADGRLLRSAGAVPFHDMAALPGLVALAARRAAA